MGDPGALARNLIQKNFPKFGTIRKANTFQQMSAPTYTVATGNVVDVVTASYPLLAIWASFNFSKGSAQYIKFDESTILSIDKYIIYPSLDLPVEAKVGDRVVDSSGVTWSVMAVEYDPAGAHYELHVRPLAAT